MDNTPAEAYETLARIIRDITYVGSDGIVYPSYREDAPLSEYHPDLLEVWSIALPNPPTGADKP